MPHHDRPVILKVTILQSQARAGDSGVLPLMGQSGARIISPYKKILSDWPYCYVSILHYNSNSNFYTVHANYIDTILA